MKAVFEKVQTGPDRSFACLEWRGPVFKCPYHVHPEFELNFIVSSSGERFVGDHIGQFAPGDLVMFGPNLPHMFHHLRSRGYPRDWARSYYIQFLPDCLGPGFFALPELAGIQELLAKSSRGIQFDRDCARKAFAKMEEIYAASGGLRIAKFLELLELLSESQKIELLASARFCSGHEHKNSKRMDRVMDYLNKNLFGVIRLKEVAKAGGMSPQAFSRFFARLMGRPLVEYVNELRVAAASRRLIETDLSVLEISLECGYGNLSNFNRHFRKLKGTTPRSFRRLFEARTGRPE